MGDLTKNFSRKEFVCKCGCGQENMHYGFVLALQRVRNETKYKIKINSGFRCRKHNKAVGGKPTSSHLRGIAVDIACKGSAKRYRLLALLPAEFNRVGIGKDFIHVDSDGAKARNVIWVY
jgi:uncharacterized protein YcbK (DUF882 family)|tara:strand:- start:3462 stop:3821 length:360 start_codon:yes stop_codon:yes gene_type:complete